MHDSESPNRQLFHRGIQAIGALAVAAIVVMITSTLIQVVMRYGLNAPPAWTEELARYGMVWAGLLGAVVAFYHREDPTLVKGWSDRAGWRGRCAAVCRAVATTVFLGPVVWYSLFGAGMNPQRGFIARSAGRQAEMLDIPMAWVAMIVPLTLGAIILLSWTQAITGATSRSDAESTGGQATSAGEK